MSYKKEILTIFAVAIVIRIGFDIPAFLGNRKPFSIGDTTDYQQIAINLTRYHRFSSDPSPPFHPNIFRAPIYPLFIASIYSLTGESPVGVIIIQAVLGGITGILLFFLGMRLTNSIKISFLGGILFALSPNSALYASSTWTEPLFTLILLTASYLFVQFLHNFRLALLLFSALLFGIATLCRHIGLYLPIPLLFGLIWYQRKKRTFPLVPILGFVIVYLATLSPWYIRNTLTFNRPILTTVGEYNILNYYASMVVSHTKKIPLEQSQKEVNEELDLKINGKNLNEAYVAKEGAQIGLQHIKRFPLTYIRLHLTSFILNYTLPIGMTPLVVCFVGKKPEEFGIQTSLRQDVFLGRKSILEILNQRFKNIPFFVLCIYIIAPFFQGGILLGNLLFLIHPFKRKLLLLLIPIIYFSLLTGTLSDSRFRVPIEPFLALMAAAGFYGFQRKV